MIACILQWLSQGLQWPAASNRWWVKYFYQLASSGSWQSPWNTFLKLLIQLESRFWQRSYHDFPSLLNAKVFTLGFTVLTQLQKLGNTFRWLNGLPRHLTKHFEHPQTSLELVNSQFLTVDLTENGKIQQICWYSSMKPLLISVNKVNAIFGTILRKNPICNHY